MHLMCNDPECRWEAQVEGNLIKWQKYQIRFGFNFKVRRRAFCGAATFCGCERARSERANVDQCRAGCCSQKFIASFFMQTENKH